MSEFREIASELSIGTGSIVEVSLEALKDLFVDAMVSNQHIVAYRFEFTYETGNKSVIEGSILGDVEK